MTKNIINTPDAPRAIGPYNQAVVAGGFVFCSGQISLNPQNGDELTGGSVDVQTRQVLANLKAVLTAAGSGLDKVVKTTVFLADMGDFAAMNAVYAEYFPNDAPARATVQAARLPKDVLVEIDCIALAP